MLCHDGSKASVDALNETLSSLIQDNDTLTVAHVFNLEKEKYLKSDLKRDYIRGTSDAACISLGNKYFYTETEHNDKDSETIKTKLNTIAKDRHIDI